MEHIKIYQTQKHNLSTVQKFLSMIGKREQTTAKSIGKVSSIKVSVEISYQETDGAKNYHTNEYFDADLAHIIKQRFPELAKEAVQYREFLVAHAAKLAKEELAKVQAEFEALESKL